LVKPNTALTGVPSGRVIGGRAWKARKMKPDPSTRTRCSFSAPSGSPAGSVAAIETGAIVQHEQAGTVRAHDLARLDAEPDARMAERAHPAVAGDDARIHMDRFGR